MGNTNFADIRGPLVARANIQSHAAGDATADHPIYRAPFACRIRKVTIVPAATITGAATNNFNLNLKSWTDAATPVATERANRDYGSGTNEVAMKARDLYAPATPLALAEGEYLSIERELVGTGLASPNIGVEVEYESQ
jgi:hypothetical protein